MVKAQHVQPDAESQTPFLTPGMTDAITTLERANDDRDALWHSPAQGMINYTDHITRLMEDVIARVPDLGYIDLSRVLVFARFGRSEAEGAYATCHALSLPSSEPS